MSFILNHADSMGGAIYLRDSKCSSELFLPVECFISIYTGGLDPSARINLILFLNNSAGSTGSALYGGQLDKYRLYFGNRFHNDSAIGLFMNMSRIIQHNEPESTKSISSPAEQIKFV